MPARTIPAICAFSVVLMLLFPAFQGLATEDFARETGRACRECHLDPSGGGELTAAGKAFLAGRPEAGKAHPGSSLFHRMVRFKRLDEASAMSRTTIIFLKVGMAILVLTEAERPRPYRCMAEGC